MSERNTVVGKILLIFVFSAQKYKIVSWSRLVVAVVADEIEISPRSKRQSANRIQNACVEEEVPDPRRRSLKRAQRDDSRLETRHDNNNNKAAISKYLV